MFWFIFPGIWCSRKGEDSGSRFSTHFSLPNLIFFFHGLTVAATIEWRIYIFYQVNCTQLLSLSLSLFLLLCFLVRIVSDEIKSWEAQQSTKECIYRAVIVAQLVDRSLPTQEVRSLNPAIGKIYWTYLNI